MDEVIRQMVNDSDFFVHVAGEALAKLRATYGDSLSHVDIRRVCEALEGFDFGLDAWTVTLAGPERHNGEKPYTYVIYADDADDAEERVKAHFIHEQDTDDVVVLEVKAGVPDRNCGYHWNDLRQNANA